MYDKEEESLREGQKLDKPRLVILCTVVLWLDPKESGIVGNSLVDSSVIDPLKGQLVCHQLSSHLCSKSSDVNELNSFFVVQYYH